MPHLQLYLSENTVHVPVYTSTTAFYCLLGSWRSLHKREGRDALFKAINSSSNHFCLESSEGFTELTSSIYQNSSPVTRQLCTDITRLFPACNIYTQRQGLWWEKEHLKNCVLQRKQTGERAGRRVLGEGWWKNCKLGVMGTAKMAHLLSMHWVSVPVRHSSWRSNKFTWWKKAGLRQFLCRAPAPRGSRDKKHLLRLKLRDPLNSTAWLKQKQLRPMFWQGNFVPKYRLVLQWLHCWDWEYLQHQGFLVAFYTKVWSDSCYFSVQTFSRYC